MTLWCHKPPCEGSQEKWRHFYDSRGAAISSVSTWRFHWEKLGVICLKPAEVEQQQL